MHAKARCERSSTTLSHWLRYVLPKQASEYFATGELNAKEVLIGANLFDGLETYYLPYMQNASPSMALSCQSSSVSPALRQAGPMTERTSSGSKRS